MLAVSHLRPACVAGLRIGGIDAGHDFAMPRRLPVCVAPCEHAHEHVDIPDIDRKSGASQAHDWAGMACAALLGVTAGVQMSDRGLQSILSPAIRQTLGVGDAVMGALHGSAGFLIAIALALALALPLARLVDRHSRKRIQSLIHRAMLTRPIPWRGALPHPLTASSPPRTGTTAVPAARP